MSIDAFIAKLESEYVARHNMLVPKTISTITCGNMWLTVLTIEQVGAIYVVTETCEADDMGDFESPSVAYFADLPSAEAYVEFRRADVP